MPDLLERLQAALADRYTVERELGRGGMATVYLAHDLKLDRPVALKVLKPELAAALGTDRFLREIKLAAQLQHPHIIPLHDSGTAGGFVYYVMAYVEGESLRDRLRRERQLPIEDALQIVREVAAGLTHAHSHAVIHRDIKPENILLFGDIAVVADFGIARAVAEAGEERLTETGLAIGTPPYMSPEQGGGSKDVDGRSDIYGLACVLYEMLLGHPPFGGTTAQEILARHSLEAPPPLRVARTTVPEAVERAVLRALAKVPADRFATAAQFAEGLTGAGTASRGAWKLAAGITGVAALLAIGLLVPQSPLARLLPGSGTPADTTPRPWTILADFEGSADSSLRRTVRDIVRDALDQSTIIRALTEQDVMRGLELAGKPSETPLDVEVARELAERHGIRTVIAGQVDRVGESYPLAVRVLDRDRGTVIAVARETARGEDGIMPSLGRLVRNLRRELGERPGRIREEAITFGVPVGTLSLEAFRVDGEARRLYQTEGASRQSIALFREALALDSGFIRAWSGLGTHLFNLGFRDSAIATFVEARRWLGRESEEERLILEIFEAWVRGDGERQYRGAERMADVSPDVPVSHFHRGLALMMLGRFEESVDAFERSEALAPVAVIPTNLFNRVVSLVMLDRLDEAWAVAERIPGPRGSWARLHVVGARGDWALADSVATAFEQDPATANRRGYGVPVLRASVLATRGAAAAAARALKQVANTGTSHRLVTLLGMYSGRSVGVPDAALSEDTSAGASITLAVGAALLGDTLAAQRRFAELTARLGDQVAEYGAWPEFVRALVAAQGSRWKEVNELLGAKAVDPLAENPLYHQDEVGLVPLRWLVARAYEQLGHVDSAIAFYELVISRRIFSPSQSLQRGLAYSFALQRLVVLNARAGRWEEAWRHWNVFNETFTDPDPDIRYLVDEAREALEAERKAG